VGSGPQSILRVELLIEGAVEALRVDAEISQESRYGLIVSRRFCQALAAPVTNERAAPCAKLIAFGVPPEVVVVIENEDARFRILFLMKVGRGETTDAYPTTTRSQTSGSGSSTGPQSF